MQGPNVCSVCMPYLDTLQPLLSGFKMASRLLSRCESEVSADISDAKAAAKKSRDDVCTVLMCGVVPRSSGIGSSKRAWMKPPS